MRTQQRELVGHCAVDSGQIMLTDPCYVKHFIDEIEIGQGFDANLTPINGSYPYTYNGACSATCSDNMTGQLGLNFPEAVTISSGYGDGVYPVYVTRASDGRIATATIVFIDDEEYDEEYDDEA